MMEVDGHKMTNPRVHVNIGAFPLYDFLPHLELVSENFLQFLSSAAIVLLGCLAVSSYLPLLTTCVYLSL